LGLTLRGKYFKHLFDLCRKWIKNAARAGFGLGAGLTSAQFLFCCTFDLSMNTPVREFFPGRRNVPAVVTAVLALLTLAGCNRTPPVVAAPPHAVAAATAVAKDVPRYVDALGQATASESVNIVSQVEGQIVQMPFKQGSMVNAGDVLAVIFAPPFQAMVNQADGQLTADQATLVVAEKLVARSKSLLPEKLVSQQQYDADAAVADQLSGKVKVDEAQLDLAKINLDYTTIKAPVSGMVGTFRINVGNVVKADDLPITTIETMDPIYVDCVVSVSSFPALRKYFDQNGGHLPVHVASQSDPDQARDGNLTILGNAIAGLTGTASLRATLPNADRLFWPNEPVRARIFLETVKDAVLVPATAVQLSQQGQFVFVIKPGSAGKPATTEKRMVQTGQGQDDGTIVITSGLTAGEQVVVAGQIFLLPDMPVEVEELDGKTLAAPAAANSAPKS
jgi:membrane fusion protein, multidrug efflux system